MRKILAILLIGILAVAACDQVVDTPTPLPPDTPTAEPMATEVPSPGPTPTPLVVVVTATPTVTPIPIPTPIPADTPTPHPVPTDTPTATPVDTPTPVPTNTPSPIPTSTSTPRPTSTPTPIPTPTATPTPRPTNTPTPVPSPTPTPIATPIPTPIFSSQDLVNTGRSDFLEITGEDRWRKPGDPIWTGGDEVHPEVDEYYEFESLENNDTLYIFTAKLRTSRDRIDFTRLANDLETKKCIAAGGTWLSLTDSCLESLDWRVLDEVHRTGTTGGNFSKYTSFTMRPFLVSIGSSEQTFFYEKVEFILGECSCTIFGYFDNRGLAEPLGRLIANRLARRHYCKYDGPAPPTHAPVPTVVPPTHTPVPTVAPPTHTPVPTVTPPTPTPVPTAVGRSIGLFDVAGVEFGAHVSSAQKARIGSLLERAEEAMPESLRRAIDRYVKSSVVHDIVTENPNWCAWFRSYRGTARSSVIIPWRAHDEGVRCEDDDVIVGTIIHEVVHAIDYYLSDYYRSQTWIAEGVTSMAKQLYDEAMLERGRRASMRCCDINLPRLFNQPSGLKEREYLAYHIGWYYSPQFSPGSRAQILQYMRDEAPAMLAFIEFIDSNSILIDE